MALVNAAVTAAPQNRVPHKASLGSIGLTTRAIKLSSTVNIDGLNAEAFNKKMEDINLEAWWICLPTEIHNSNSAVDPTTGQLMGMQGNILRPTFDKAIWSTDPGAAVTTCVYNTTELHLESKDHTTWYLTCVVVNKLKQLQGIGNNTVNLFNRAFIRPQLQIEAGNVVKFTADEQASTQTWEVTSMRDNTVLHQVTSELSWDSSYLWSFSYVFPTSLSQHVFYASFGIWWGGCSSTAHPNRNEATLGYPQHKVLVETDPTHPNRRIKVTGQIEGQQENRRVGDPQHQFRTVWILPVHRVTLNDYRNKPDPVPEDDNMDDEERPNIEVADG